MSKLTKSDHIAKWNKLVITKHRIREPAVYSATKFPFGNSPIPIWQLLQLPLVGAPIARFAILSFIYANNILFHNALLCLESAQ